VLRPSPPLDAPAPTLPMSLRIVPPAPNPTRAGTAFHIALPSAARVKADILDQQGRVIRTLADGDVGAGERDLFWDGCTRSGSRVPSGLYFYRIVVGTQSRKGRVAIVR
jgi:flagellar hook assembly protein FlgD